MPGRAPRQKGDRFERLLVELLRAAGLDAKRVPLSGSVAGFNADVILTIGREQLKGECKCRGRSFSRLYKWLAKNDFLAIKADYGKPLIVIEAERLAAILAHPIGYNPTETTKDKPFINSIPDIDKSNIQPVTSSVDLSDSDVVRLYPSKPPVI